MSNRKPNQRKYLANIIGASFGRSSNGNEQIALECDITEGPDDLSTIAYTGTFTDNSFEYTEKALRACGWEGDDLSEIPALAAAGRLGPVELVVYDDTFEGTTRAKVLFINKPGGGRFKFKEGSEITGSDLRSFAARMKSAFSGNRPAPARQPSNGSRPPAARSGNGFDGRDVPPPADDDLPF